MKELLDCYIPIFKFILKTVNINDRYTDYSSFRNDCILQLEQAISNANYLDSCIDEKNAARLAVIAWVDEMILCSSLPWKDHWQGEPLQKTYLDTIIAGEEFFLQLEQLLPEYQQSRRVFLFCLQNGFHGRFITPQDQDALSQLIISQREQCLPGLWDSWPNEEVITPIVNLELSNISHRKNIAIILSITLILLYIFAYLSLYILHEYHA